MASAPTLAPSTKETTNYARLCRLLVDGGTKALRYTFDKFHSPANLFNVLKAGSAEHSTLQSLKKKRIINATQWGKLYPSPPSSVTSEYFDITLLMVLLRNICGLAAPATGWDSLPPASDTSVEANIARVKHYRNSVYGHASQAFVDDPTFNSFWQDVSAALVVLGVDAAAITKLKTETIDPDMETHYRELLKEWKKDEDNVKDKLKKMEGAIRDDLEDIKSELGSVSKTLENLEMSSVESDDATRDDVKCIKSEIGSISSKLRTLETFAAEIEDAIQDDLKDIKTEIGSISEKLESLEISSARHEAEVKDNLEQIRKEMEKIMGKLDRKERGKKASKVVLIDEHIESIRQKYERLEGWLAPFPWCEDFQFHLNDIYTRLLMVSRGKKARGTGIESVVEMAEIFKPHEECKQPKKVLIEGNPGMGKTTYCNKVAYDWATKKHSAEGCFPKFDLVLMLKCRDVGRNSDLWEAIDDQLLPREVQKEERDTLFEFIRQNQSKILLILDGLDELPTGRLPEFAEIIQGKMLPLCHLVVTARQEAGIPVRNVCDTLLEIKGFTPGDAIQFILKFFSGKEELVEALFHRLLEDTSLQHMIANPLHTALLCLLCEDFDGILPERITQLYSEIVQCVLRRYRKKKGLTVDDEDPIEIYEDQLKHLGSIALNGLRENNMYFDNKRLGSGYSDLPGFGFLSVQPGSSKRRPCLCYGFTHKSFQEFFAGHYLCCQLVSKEISPEEVVADMRYFVELRQVLQFASGLLAVRSEESVASLINSITNEVNAMEEEGLIEYYLPVALECIKECEKGSSNFHLELARTFGLCLKVKEADLKNQQIGDATAVVFGAALETNTTLSGLDLSYNNLRLAAAESLAAALEINATLTYLNLSYNELGPSGAESLARAFERNTSLTILDLSYNGLGPAGADYLASALKTNTTLTNLTVSGNCLGPAGAESFASALITNTSLTNLDLSGNNIGPVGIESLSVALKTNATMTDLVLTANKLGPVDADLLVAALETNKTLEYLKLSHNDLGPAGAKSLSGALETNATLKLLDLSYNDVGSAGARSLSTALETNRALTLLDLSYNDVGPSGAESLAAMLKVNTTLTLLNLCFNDLGSSIELFVDALHVNSTIDFLLLSAKNAGESVRSKLKEAHGTRLTVF